MRLIIFLILVPLIVNSQSIRINEVVSSNSIYFDEDGDSPDWIELYNYGNQTISLENWTISDNTENPEMWAFPQISLNPEEYLLIWASGKNRSQISYSRTHINQGDIFKYIIPNSEPNSDWKNTNFNDSNWFDGATGFGYADGDDTTILPNGTLSVYMRKNFTISDLENMTSFILDIDYDDGFVAYINGIEIARANINGSPPTFDQGTIIDHEAQIYTGGIPDRFPISDFNSILVEGENVLAIQAHNVSSGSSDFTVIPFISALYSEPTNEGIIPPVVLNLTDENTLHTNFKISTSGETLILSNNEGNSIDQLTVEGLPPNTSIGVSNFNQNIVSYVNTTPGYLNDNQEFLGSIQNEVIFSVPGGFVNNSFNLALSGNSSSQTIRYTTDGSIPTLNSEIYSSPINIFSNKTIRASIFSENYLPSLIKTESYIFNSNHDIDVMLLTIDPYDFFDEENGIYVFGEEGSFDPWVPYYGANFWEDWERAAHFSFHENENDEIVEFDGGVKIFGGWSRGQNGQKSLAFFARGQYGDSEFEHNFFDNLNYDEFESFVLRSSGQDWLRSNMKDIMLTSLMRGSELDFQEHNPVATYINGEYWGMYNMREKINEHMLASKHDVDANSITLLTNNSEVIEGSNEEYNDLIDYIETTDLSIDSNFEYVKENIDLKQYALYQATNIFINNTDWPGNNIKFWKSPETKWRWIMYDTDFGFGPWWNWGNFNENTLDFALYPDGNGWPNPSWSTLLFRRLITNIGFRNQFINRYADELNTRFLSNNVVNHINEIYSTIEPEIMSHFYRWRNDPSVGYEIPDPQGHVEFYIWAMTNFANERPSIAKEHIKEQFDLPDYHELTITNPSTYKGFVNINDNLNIQEPSWVGDYFETVPVTLKAVPELGFEFSHWSGDLFSNDQTIELLIDQAFEVIPNFSELSTEVVINEINYRSSDEFNPDDWIELFNPKPTAIDISNWQIKDSDDNHIFTIPNGTEIEGNDYLVIVKDESDFVSFFNDIPYIGELGFGLGRYDSVRLYNSNGNIIDEVNYGSDYPWPTCADGTGNSLELIEFQLDNAIAENWDCINENGSPNAVNSNSLSNIDNNIHNIKIYPNPVNNKLYINSNSSNYSIEVISLLGQNLIKAYNTNVVDLSLLSEGVYLIKIEVSGTTSTFKIIKQ